MSVQNKKLLFMLLCSLILLLCLIANGSSLILPAEIKDKYADKTLESLSVLIEFFEKHASDINLDGIYGLRLAQGQLLQLNDYLTKFKSKYTDQNLHIKKLADKIDSIANESLSTIKQNFFDYYIRFLPVASKPFICEYKQRPIREHLIRQDNLDSTFDEDTSDDCFAEVLGTTNDKNTKQCMIDEQCWKMMTIDNGQDYKLTHQLLWFILAKSIGCLDNRKSSALANKHLEYIEDKFCSNIYRDAVTNKKQGRNQDLFLEQILLCSILGYEDFLKIEWLNDILQWQQPTGCFSDMSEIWTVDTKSFKKRQLLVEQEMADGCLSHKSGLASGVLAVYLRALSQ
ncbi:unnamed protein product [Didymodactylos carnosus]|uniref:Uncharacterized protein n=1 Tax=Didymodactylos carnosus TaxID=1234261 RepID=A0A814BLF2_9BILA|nr:unnamed protein product [Didymodactylos carnosus]CAF0930964.1 unnamed protein product [Didymodactylos carnosus]CAF3557571.1 unnamed protein product [Didymodactylos carnosus]CAF3708901.1 unnamed protein product [Didymodactylos carnosus]